LNQRSDIAALIREIRGRLGITQEELAAQLGVTLPTINRWENGRVAPSKLAIRQIEQLLRNMADGEDLLATFLDLGIRRVSKAGDGANPGK
jgi:putative transcriptional regulator